MTGKSTIVNVLLEIELYLHRIFFGSNHFRFVDPGVQG